MQNKLECTKTKRRSKDGEETTEYVRGSWKATSEVVGKEKQWQRKRSRGERTKIMQS